MSWGSITGYASELTFDFFSRHRSHALQTLLRVLFSESERVSRCWVPIIWDLNRWQKQLVYKMGQVSSQVDMCKAAASVLGAQWILELSR